MKTVYLGGDTLTGLFSALYDAWKAALAAKREQRRRLAEMM